MLSLALLLVAALGVGGYVGVRALIGVVGDLTASEGPTTTTEPSPGATPTEVTTEQLANPVACEPDAVRLTAGLPDGGLRAGQETRVPVTVTNTGEMPCLVDVGPAGLRLELESGDDLVWSSEHCADPESSRPLLLDVGAEEGATVTWPGTRSAQGCPSDQGPAEPGTYALTAVLDLGADVTDTETLTMR